MYIGIIGSRTFNDYVMMIKFILNYVKIIEIECVVSGGAEGADKLGEKFAEEYGIPTKIFLPDWKNLGKIAGKIRNTDIVLNSHIVFIFWNGVSKGTKDSIDKCIKYKIPHYIFYFGNAPQKPPIKGFQL